MSDKFDSEDLELENAIGDVFKLLDLTQIKQNQDQQHEELIDNHQDESHPDDIYHDKEHNYEGSHGEEHKQVEQHISHEEEHHNDDALIDMNIEEAIQYAFLNQNEIRHTKDDHHDKEHKSEEESPEQKQVEHDGNDYEHQEKEGEHEEHQDDDDFSLANAITSAIQSIDTIGQDTTKASEEQQEVEKDEQLEDSQEKPEHKDNQQAQIPDQSSNQNVYSPLQVEKSYEDDEDFDLQNAIGDAFESIKKSSTLDDDDKLKKAISDSLKNLVDKPHDDKHDKSRKNEHISDDILQELAKEITNQVSQVDDPNQTKNKHLDLPKIDENVLNHFVNEAHREKLTKHSQETRNQTETGAEDEDDSQLQSTIADAVKNVIGEPQEQNKEVDLSNLQMNDILTNAFNMAMENPTELLNNLETDDVKQRESLQISGEINKKLLAIDALNLKKPGDLSSQLSNMMSTLSNNSDSSLLTVIRSLTTFLSNSNFQIFKSSQSLISIINQYKNNDLEKLFINSLNLSKNYLRSNSKLKSIIAIDNVLILFGKPINGETLNYNYNLITLITNSIINCISTFTNLKKFKSTIFDKPKMTELEHKEKIRIENRERKKRWREENSERNKDNDLRARVLKRANTMFGQGDSIEKLNWVEEEYNKRRERRLLREKKEAEKNASGVHPKDFNTEQFTQDKILIQMITDYFNIFSNFAPKDDPETGLFTTAVTIASISILYLLSFNQNFEFKKIDTVVSSIINNLLDTFNSVDQQERLLYLAKGSTIKLDNLKSSYSDELDFDVERTATTLSLQFDRPASTHDELVNLENQDEGHQAKKLKTGSKIETPAAVNLKFPSYKHDESLKRAESSPSTKPSSNIPAVSNLKKPSSFKRPSYNDKKSKSMGFPPLYSTSIKH